MTASESRRDGPWTLDDLPDLPDDGNRYELIEGNLLVGPAPAIPHVRAANRLHRRLSRQAPDQFTVCQGGGVYPVSRKTYLIPDLFVVLDKTLDGDGPGFVPAEILLAVEVLSPSTRRSDLVAKRHQYAAMGIPRYWIVDPKARTLAVLALKEDRYREEALVEAGQRWYTEEPFPLDLDPADFC